MPQVSQEVQPTADLSQSSNSKIIPAALPTMPPISIPSALPIPVTGVTPSPQPMAIAVAVPSPTSEPTLVLAIPTPGITRAPVVRAPIKTSTPIKVLPTPTPSFPYHVNFSWCGPNWLTFIEGTVTQDGIQRNGLRVRVSQGPDGLAAWNDYVTGTDSTKPGGYTHIIDANAPHGGTWYLWLIDPQTNQRVSDIATVKTDPKRQDETSCQSANVNFSTP
ncbi:MAG: hypothetical protein HZB51_26275 [Chloroflexi bacterium]|nr:hypothetical protein [Chloroflexota bacterium]